MDIKQVTKPKGGMCENPYGGHFRLDKFELLGTGDGKTEPLEMVFRQLITNTVSNYIFFGLGHNGYGCADEFLMAHDYFFTVTSDRPETWNPDRQIRVTDIEQGIHKWQQFVDLTDEQMADGCFDRHWIMSGLDRAMNISTFKRLLRRKRRNIIEANYQQVKNYLHTLRDQAAGRGEYLKPCLYQGDLLETLVEPTDEALASLLYPVRQVAQIAHRSPFRLPRRIHGHRDWSNKKAAPVRAASAEV